MLKKHSQLFRNLLLLSDLVIISLTWWVSYYLRFYSDLIPVYFGFQSIKPYLLFVLPILIIWGGIFKAFNLYRPRRLSTHLGEIFDIAKACTLAVTILISITFFFKQFEFSRLVFLYFWGLSIVAMSLSRGIFRELLRFFRKKGYNLRHVIIVGDGTLAREIIKRLVNHPELGINIIGVLSSKPEKVGKKVHGKEIIGIYKDIEKIFKTRKIDQVFIAIPFSEMNCLDSVLKYISKQPVNIKIIPDIHHFLPFCGSVEEFDGLPILGIQDSPLYGWNIVLKSASDILISFVSILITFPVMLLIAVVVKLTSPGPVFFRQKRAGLDGRTFDMLKFRTMHVEAEKDIGPVWAKENDTRRTKFGTLLRRTSLDELPQFFNVLKGDMSVVGPRPERPEFIENFKEQIPRYMLRHKMKAGITGWAQINGWRGNTSINKRIECDLYYIEHWSLLFDLKIMFLTVLKGFIHKHAY